MKETSLTDKNFEALFLEYFRPLTVYAMQFVTNQMVAEDIVHDLFIKLYENREAHSLKTLTGNYFYRSVHNRCLNQLDHKKVRLDKNPEIQESITYAPSDPFEIVSFIEFEHKFMQSLELLPPKCRKIFEMSRMEGKKNHDIADELKISKRTVETQISQALKVMKKKLIKYLPVIFIGM
jgi:RNA polymerase sigma-70 factor (family 1)